MVFNYAGRHRYGLNVLMGALESVPQVASDLFVAWEFDELTQHISDALGGYDKVLVLWSFYSPEFWEACNSLSKVKESGSALDDPRIVHLCGGVHATGDPQRTLRAGFDRISVGEGERRIVEIATKLSNGDDIRTLALGRLDDGKYISAGFTEPIDLNSYPPFAPAHKRFNPIEITRGCIYACRFCQTPFMFKASHFRHRSVEEICRYAQMMKQEGKRDIRFITPNALSYGSNDKSVNMDEIERLLREVRLAIGPDAGLFFGTFPSEFRPEHVTPRVLRIMKRYVTNDNVIIGAQSGSERMLAESHRGHSLAPIFQAVRYCLDEGFVPKVDLIFGLPGEHEDELEASVLLAERLIRQKAEVNAHTFMPLPGTPWRNAEPGKLPPRIVNELDVLAKSGRLRGDWKQQIAIAADLHARSKSAISEAKSR